ncbi:MAG: CinA family protein [Candidatus Gastranaerophilaceae bacterium]
MFIKTVFDFLTLNPEKKISGILTRKNKTVAVGESCTGGLVSSLLTDVSGSSAFIMSNFVTYSNAAKARFIGVSENTLETFGAVSEQTAKEAALGLLKVSGCDYSLMTTGIAGPSGGTAEKPVGLVYFGIANKNRVKVVKFVAPPCPGRRFRKLVFAKKALNELLNFIEEENRKD